MIKKINRFLSNIYAILIVGLIFTISLAINTISLDVKNTYIKEGSQYHIVFDILYFFVLFIILLVLLYLYKGSLNVSQFILNNT